MEKKEIIKSISARGNGEIYLGVVGAVRTGKSTFIKKVIETLVVPNIEDEFEKKKCLDEIPQSATGKQIMTTEPKFVPSSGANIKVDEITTNVKLIDCVGYVIPAASGYEDELGNPRLVKTPWYEDEIPFMEAAEIGTEKVIKDHSTIGIVMTTDGSIGTLGRNEFIEAEEKVITELKQINKPFIVILNSTHPNSDVTKNLAEEMRNTYDTPILPMDVENMNEIDLYNVLKTALYEFPVVDVKIQIPEWIHVLSKNNPIKSHYMEKIKESVISVEKINTFLMWMRDDKFSDILCLAVCLKGIEVELEKVNDSVDDLNLPDFFNSKLTRKFSDGYLKDVRSSYLKDMDKELGKDLDELKVFKDKKIREHVSLKRNVNKQLKNLEELKVMIQNKTITIEKLLKLTGDIELINICLIEIIKMNNVKFLDKHQQLINLEKNPVNVLEKVFNAYGYNFNSLTEEEQNILMSVDNNEKLAENLSFLSTSSLKFINENDNVFINILLLDMESLVKLDSLFLRGKLTNNFILRYGKKFNSFVIKQLIQNISKLDMQKIDFESLLQYNNKILLDCGNGITRNLNFPEDLNNLTIIISHLHRDHYSDIFSIAYATYA